MADQKLPTSIEFRKRLLNEMIKALGTVDDTAERVRIRSEFGKAIAEAAPKPAR